MYWNNEWIKNKKNLKKNLLIEISNCRESENKREKERKGEPESTGEERRKRKKERELVLVAGVAVTMREAVTVWPWPRPSGRVTAWRGKDERVKERLREKPYLFRADRRRHAAWRKCSVFHWWGLAGVS